MGFVLLAPMLVSSFQGMGVTMGKVPWVSMLGSIFVSSFEGMREVTMGKVPWGSMLASTLASMSVSSCQAWFPNFTIWAKLKGTVGAHVGCHVSFHVGLQLPGCGGGHNGKDIGWSPSCPALSMWTGCRRTFPCWVEVLEPLRLPLSQPGAFAPGGSARTFPCWVEVLEPLRLLVGQRGS